MMKKEDKEEQNDNNNNQQDILCGIRIDKTKKVTKQNTRY